MDNAPPAERLVRALELSSAHPIIHMVWQGTRHEWRGAKTIFLTQRIPIEEAIGFSKVHFNHLVRSRVDGKVS
jgi:hypothetical protein